MAMSSSFCAIQHLRTSVNYTSRWIEVLPSSGSIPILSWDFFGMRGSV